MVGDVELFSEKQEMSVRDAETRLDQVEEVVALTLSWMDSRMEECHLKTSVATDLHPIIQLYLIAFHSRLEQSWGTLISKSLSSPATAKHSSALSTDIRPTLC